MEEAGEQPSWSDVPIELIAEVFKYCSERPEDKAVLSRLSRVCRSWRLLAQEPSFWLPSDLAKIWPPNCQVNIKCKEQCFPPSVVDRKKVTNVQFDIEYSHLPLLVRSGLVEVLPRPSSSSPSSSSQSDDPLTRWIFVYKSLERMTECFCLLSKLPPQEQSCEGALQEYIDPQTGRASFQNGYHWFQGSAWFGSYGGWPHNPQKVVNDIVKDLAKNPRLIVNMEGSVLAVTSEGDAQRIWIGHSQTTGVSSDPMIASILMSPEAPSKHGLSVQGNSFHSGYVSRKGVLFLFDTAGVHVRKDYKDGKFEYMPLFLENHKRNRWKESSGRSLKYLRASEDAFGNVYVWAPWGNTGWVGTGTIGYFLYCHATSSWTHHSEIEHIDSVIGLGNAIDKESLHGEDALIVHCTENCQKHGFILIKRGSETPITNQMKIFKLLGMPTFICLAVEPTKAESFGVNRIAFVGHYRLSLEHRPFDQPIYLCLSMPWQGASQEIAVTFNLAERTAENAESPIMIQLPNNVKEFLKRTKPEYIVQASNGWLFGIDTKDNQVIALSSDYQRVERLVSTSALIDLEFIDAVPSPESPHLMTLLLRGSSKAWTVTVDIRFKFPAGFLPEQLYSTMVVPLPGNCGYNQINCTDTLGQVWACGSRSTEPYNLDVSMMCLNPDTLQWRIWPECIQGELANSFAGVNGKVFTITANGRVYIHDSNSEEVVEAPSFIELLREKGDMVRDILLDQPPLTSLVAKTKLKVVKDATGCIWWNVEKKDWGVMDNTPRHTLHVFASSTFNDSLDNLKEEPPYLIRDAKDQAGEKIATMGPCVNKSIILMFPLGDGVVFVEEDTRIGRFVRVVDVPQEGDKPSSRVEVVCDLPKIEYSPVLPESFRYEGSDFRSFWLCAGENGRMITYLFQLTEDGTAIEKKWSHNAQLMCKDRLGGLWFHNGRQSEWKVHRLASMSDDETKAPKTLIRDAYGSWGYYDSIQISENMATTGDHIELWYICRSGLRPILLDASSGVIKIGRSWFVNGILSENADGRPAICYPSNPTWKWIGQGLGRDWPRLYSLRCQALPAVEGEQDDKED